MKKKLIITERQHELIKKVILESTYHEKMVETIKNDLDMNYEAMSAIMREGGEYFEKPMIKIKVDGEMISPRALYEYLKYKYKLGDDFIQQVIRDWAFGVIDDNRLTKNVALN